MPYFQGCLSGGAASSYLKMAEEIKKMVDADLEKNINGKWWDESYMNKYFQKILHKYYPLHMHTQRLLIFLVKR